MQDPEDLYVLLHVSSLDKRYHIQQGEYMKPFAIFLMSAALLAGAGPKKTFTGVITDDMCGNDHKMMNVSPDKKCVTECIKGGSKYALLDGKTVYALSDQKQAAKFPAQKVTVTGSL